MRSAEIGRKQQNMTKYDEKKLNVNIMRTLRIANQLMIKRSCTKLKIRIAVFQAEMGNFRKSKFGFPISRNFWESVEISGNLWKSVKIYSNIKTRH